MTKVIHLLFLVVALSLTACASAQLEKNMKEQRGYSAEDIASIQAQGKEYKERLVAGAFQKLTQDEYDRAIDGLKTIACKCHKVMGNKCRENSSGVNAEQKPLWIKANAVDWAIASAKDVHLDRKVASIDPDTCE